MRSVLIAGNHSVLARGLSWTAVASVLVCTAACGGDDEGNGGDTSDSGSGTGGSGAAMDGGLDAGGDAMDNPGTGGRPNPDLCGNGMVDPGEDCEDGNSNEDDGCRSDCTFTCQQNAVGDSDCDDGNPCNGQEKCGTEHTCQPGTPPEKNYFCGVDRICENGLCVRAPEVCGDGLRIGAEECDDENDVDGDGCDSCRFSCVNDDPERRCQVSDPCEVSSVCELMTHTCRVAALADYTACTMPSGGATGACVDARCTTEYCGNNVVDAGEQCDDGNRIAGDGCEPDCQYTCEAAEDCAPPNVCLENQGCDLSTHRCNAPTQLADGTACGSGQLCVAGNCRPSECGDGVLDATATPPEVCDDGNYISGDGCDADCAYTCSGPTDCTGSLPDCRAFSCDDHRCVSVSDGSTDPCDNGAGAATCNNGACTAGTCGDGTVDTGEQCDLGGNNGPNAGCESDCTISCRTNDDCTNGESCDGAESCEQVAGAPAGVNACTNPPNVEDGTACGSASGRVCVGGACRPSFCGDGVLDLASGEECDPPSQYYCSSECEALEVCDLTGRWALKLDIDTSWAGTGPIDPGSGKIVAWVRLDITQNGLEVETSVRPCGLQTPDFLFGFLGENYGLVFPNGPIFDSGTIGVAQGSAALTGLGPGAQLDSEALPVLIGLHMDNPLAPWPALMSIIDGTAAQLRDHDGDGRNGITANVKTGGEYKQIIIDASNPAQVGRADKMDLVVRQISSLAGTMVSCTELAGQANVLSVDNSIVGCHRVLTPAVPAESLDEIPARDCTQAEYAFVDGVSPKFIPGSATFSAVKVGDNATCAQVRAARP